MKPFEQNITVHFRQTDMAGIAYFNEAFNIFHDVYEAWVGSHFKNKVDWFQNPEWAVPLKNVSCDYKAPLIPFNHYTVRISLAAKSTSTFQLKTEIVNAQVVCAELLTTHVFIDRSTKKSIPIPPKIAESLIV
jgi:1,4-dihydroxy-2-naphthoyl-CoA hydrolase